MDTIIIHHAILMYYNYLLHIVLTTTAQITATLSFMSLKSTLLATILCEPSFFYFHGSTSTSYGLAMAAGDTDS